MGLRKKISIGLWVWWVLIEKFVFLWKKWCVFGWKLGFAMGLRKECWGAGRRRRQKAGFAFIGF